MSTKEHGQQNTNGQLGGREVSCTVWGTKSDI